MEIMSFRVVAFIVGCLLLRFFEVLGLFRLLMFELELWIHMESLI